MEEIQENEYIRTPYGTIEKVENISIEKNWICVTTDKSVHTMDWLISTNVKHSKNIIDLIEVGDIVNKSEVYEIGESEDGQKWIHTFRGHLYYEKELEKTTILTHEQYENNCYRIGE